MKKVLAICFAQTNDWGVYRKDLYVCFANAKNTFCLVIKESFDALLRRLLKFLIMYLYM